VVEEPEWTTFTDEDLRRVRFVLVRAFLATLAVLLMAGLMVDVLELGEGDPIGEPSLKAQVLNLYPPGGVTELSCDDSADGARVCSYRRGRYACTYDGGTRPHCSLTAQKRQ
jgi:hypothetical protein